MKKNILIIMLGILVSMPLSAKDYFASQFGIKSNGTTLNTTAIQKAIDQISAEGGGKLMFKVGRYLTGTIELKDNVTLDFGEGAVLVGSTNPYDYRKVGNAYGLVIAHKAKNVALTGRGVIDGQGRAVANAFVGQIATGNIQDRFALGRPDVRPFLIYFESCQDATIKNLNIRNSAFWTVMVDMCENLHIDGISLVSRAFWNNDGIDITDCKNSVIENCFVDATDDGICLKSHKAHECNDGILIRNNTICSSASGIKFGTFGVGGFKNIKILDNVVYDTFRSAITIQSVDGGFAENVLVDGLKAYNTANAIYLVVGQRRGDKPSSMNDITIRNLYCEIPLIKPDYGYDYEGPTLEYEPRNTCPCAIVGLEGQDIKNVLIENVEVKFPGGGDPSYACVKTNELDKVPEQPKAYPEFSQFKELPAWGFYLRHADNVTFRNVKLSADAKDYRPCVVLDDVKNSDFKGLKAAAPSLKGKIFQAKNCRNIKK